MISLVLLICTLKSLINIPGKANATLYASHVLVTQEIIKHGSLVSDGVKPASDQFRGSKADHLGYFCVVFAILACAFVNKCLVGTYWERADLLALVCDV